jgi:hypothetical protein
MRAELVRAARFSASFLPGHSLLERLIWELESGGYVEI